ncbi:hypothetical protein ILUMI_22047 [Ignelater luminosus]|uniref:Uncharacterized protein n=1 Tax=Ignelater luminosus TaxID=2038154 RepID=A0A8K0G0W0_IGNLU|nr:hypothetical protein ILUMI_22047 [Ignelater luminosus]
MYAEADCRCQQQPPRDVNDAAYRISDLASARTRRGNAYSPKASPCASNTNRHIARTTPASPRPSATKTWVNYKIAIGLDTQPQNNLVGVQERKEQPEADKANSKSELEVIQENSTPVKIQPASPVNQRSNSQL